MLAELGVFWGVLVAYWLPTAGGRGHREPRSPSQGWHWGPRGGAHLGKPSHVVPHNLGVGALQFLDDLKALVELGENVHHGAGEERVLRGLLEL